MNKYWLYAPGNQAVSGSPFETEEEAVKVGSELITEHGCNGPYVVMKLMKHLKRKTPPRPKVEVKDFDDGN